MRVRFLLQDHAEKADAKRTTIRTLYHTKYTNEYTGRVLRLRRIAFIRRATRQEHVTGNMQGFERPV